MKTFFKMFMAAVLILVSNSAFPAPSLEDIRKAADQGDAAAQYNLGIRYEIGYSVAQNMDQAKAWYRKAAKSGDPRAQCELGGIYLSANAYNYPLGDKYLHANFGNFGGLKKNKQAAKWFCKAAKGLPQMAEQGDARAQRLLGLMYFQGFCVAEDKALSAEWLRKSLESFHERAKQGDIEAQHELATIYADNVYIKGAKQTAVEWYRKAAEQGDVKAQYQLGRYYYYGYAGVVKSRPQALEWFQKAAEQEDAEAQYMLGLDCFNSGEAPPERLMEAFKWCNKAAEQGHVDAYGLLGVMYGSSYGGLAQDDTLSFKWFLKAAEQGDGRAMNHVIHMYQQGIGVTQNRAKAHEWAKKKFPHILK